MVLTQVKLTNHFNVGIFSEVSSFKVMSFKLCIIVALMMMWALFSDVGLT